MELVTICDIWEERLIAEGKALNVLTFVNYDEFLGCDMDAVVLANHSTNTRRLPSNHSTPANSSTITPT